MADNPSDYLLDCFFCLRGDCTHLPPGESHQIMANTAFVGTPACTRCARENETLAKLDPLLGGEDYQEAHGSA